MATGRGGEHVRGRGPRPPVPTAAQAREATERLLAEILRLAGDDELVGVPGPEDMLGVVRYVRELGRREGVPPWEQVLADRAVVTRYLRDVLDREDYETLQDMARVRMPNQKQSEAFGWESKQAARQRRQALEKMFAEKVPAPRGQFRRAPRTGRGMRELQERRHRERVWMAAHEAEFVRLVEGLLSAAAACELSRENREWLEELSDEVASAREVTGEWTNAVLHLKVAAADIRRELAARDTGTPAEAAAVLRDIADFLTDLERAREHDAGIPHD